MMSITANNAAANEKYKDNQAVPVDYLGSNVYDKGHLNPNDYHGGDSKRATFTYTNVVPQLRSFNNGKWSVYEKKSKDIMSNGDRGCNADTDRRLFITGAVPGNNNVRIPTDNSSGRVVGFNRVKVPTHMWTAGCCVRGTYRDGFSFAFLGSNEQNPIMQNLKVTELQRELKTLYASSVDIILFNDNHNCWEASKDSGLALDQLPAIVACQSASASALTAACPRNTGKKKNTLSKSRQTNAGTKITLGQHGSFLLLLSWLMTYICIHF